MGESLATSCNVRLSLSIDQRAAETTQPADGKNLMRFPWASDVGFAKVKSQKWSDRSPPASAVPNVATWWKADIAGYGTIAILTR